jgi:hypothetical protein
MSDDGTYSMGRYNIVAMVDGLILQVTINI